MTDAGITRLARELGRLCKRRRVVLAVAESCTGGGLAAAITSVAGSSAWFDRGFVTYSNDAKRQMLGVRREALEKHGAVSEEVARALARGALRRSAADLCVSITGIAGPAGGSRAKPVGLVCLAWARRGDGLEVRSIRFTGDRTSVRRQAVALAIQGVIDALQ